MNSPPSLGRHVPSALSRRNFLLSTLGLAGGLTVAGCGSPVVAGLAGTTISPGTVDYWDLFGGGDGVRMQQMLAGFRKANPKLGLQAVTLAWGNPYYTKLSLATLGDKPPDVAVSHLSRVGTLVKGDLLQELTPAVLQQHGMTSDKFTASAWNDCQFDGKTYALPLDTHPFVLFYNTDICKKAGLLDSSGALVSMDGPDAFVEALTKAGKVTGGPGGVCSVNADTATNWRFFQSLYAQLGGEMLADEGTKVVLDDAKATQALEYLSKLSTAKLMPPDIDYGGSIALFASGKAGFFLQGEWEITTFQTAKTPFSMTLFPNVFGGSKYAVEADRHTLVLPRRPSADAERTDHALTLIRSLMDQSLNWAAGGHVPAWLPVKDSAEYAALQPQSNYAAAADAAVIDPPAWYSGSGSNFENVVGSAVATVRAGQASPKAAIAQMRRGLQRLADTPSPV
jgi:multiple sugar transport system substrate-binding protein